MRSTGLLGAVVCLTLGCARREPVADPAGAWVLDPPAYVPAAVRAMKAAGRIPLGGEALAGEQLRGFGFELELAADGRFTAQMGLQGEPKRYAGTWRRPTPGTVELRQTHEEDAAVADRMTGTLNGDRLVLEHDELGFRMPYVLRRPTAAAPR